MNYEIYNEKIGESRLTAALVGIVAAALTGCSKKGDSSASGSDGQKKVINVAYTNYYVPYDFVNDKGEADGFEVAVMKEVAKKLHSMTGSLRRLQMMICLLV